MEASFLDFVYLSVQCEMNRKYTTGIEPYLSILSQNLDKDLCAEGREKVIIVNHILGILPRRSLGTC